MSERLAEVEITQGRFRFPDTVLDAYPNLRGLGPLQTPVGAGALVETTIADVVESTPEVRVTQPRLTSLAQMNAYLESIGSQMFGRVFDDPTLIALMDEADTAAARAADAATIARIRAEQAAIDVIPEVVATASRFAVPEVLAGAARVLGGTPFGIASLIPEAAVYVGGLLSADALQNAIRRITPPPIAPSPPSAEPSPPDRVPAPPTGLLDSTYPDFQLPPVTVLGARPPTSLDPVFRLPTFLNPLVSFLTPGDFAIPTQVDRPVTSSAPAPRSPVSLTDFPAPSLPAPSLPAPRPSSPTVTPLLLATPLAGPGLSPPGLTPTTPTDSRRCDCGPGQPKKKRKKKQPRTECYRGEYVERSKGLLKFRKRKIPCQ